MANIMMTDACNLNCPYCFANEFVNKNKNEITEEAFDKAQTKPSGTAGCIQEIWAFWMKTVICF